MGPTPAFWKNSLKCWCTRSVYVSYVIRTSEFLPVVHLIVLPGPLRKRDLVFSVVTVDKVLHDTPGFEEVDLLAVGECVRQSWDATIRVDG
jgi:hypothetical protein